ncbi:ArsO family NAD(P)H-dependent flavin-containing monooxygenase [Lipingzhangella sp. LS1_29]|uniref:ArsO family NAD(P)H-dependent flavin-containing monooxygenase n=1 Tax=Lipingzhangella rawalii TaxID=2055835 RepID=A0ABU2H1A5_9ACTN|nr:ArsO family NAD(P)H-dependent flavin-containing monooxygenase [Lipingzhangella rawalii]MDS1269095.1 ArsO family NAD(P)H-dependent flavin-containing monooxygenase [Lipingzhangella rawalii]
MDVDVAVVGAGQAGLAAGYHLRRTGLDFVLLDDQPQPGGAWQHYWDSLRLFSPAAHSPLPGWWMPEQPGAEFPTARHVVDYLSAYEQRYQLPIYRPVRVATVHERGPRLELTTDQGLWRTRAVISATGTWSHPHVPRYPGGDTYQGRQLHTVHYRSGHEFEGQRVVIVGGGNSAAQILAEVSQYAETLWVARREPRFMPDDIDGRVLFDVATRSMATRAQGMDDTVDVSRLGDIVMVPSVRAARSRGVLKAHPMFEALTSTGVVWGQGREQWACDAVIWCTGFRPALGHLAGMDLFDVSGHIPTTGTRAHHDPRVHLLGYGDWTGRASSTIIGAGRTAKAAVRELAERVGPPRYP